MVIIRAFVLCVYVIEVRLSIQGECIHVQKKTQTLREFVQVVRKQQSHK